MAVYQVEEYYIIINFKGSLTPYAHDEIESLLSDEGYSCFEFQDSDSVLVVDGVPNEQEGEELEARIMEIVDV